MSIDNQTEEFVGTNLTSKAIQLSSEQGELQIHFQYNNQSYVFHSDVVSVNSYSRVLQFFKNSCTIIEVETPDKVKYKCVIINKEKTFLI